MRKKLKPAEELHIVQAALGQPFPEPEKAKRAPRPLPPPLPKAWQTPGALADELYGRHVKDSAAARRVAGAILARDKQFAARLRDALEHRSVADLVVFLSEVEEAAGLPHAPTPARCPDCEDGVAYGEECVTCCQPVASTCPTCKGTGSAG